MAKQAGLAGWLAGWLSLAGLRIGQDGLPHHHAFQSGPSQTKPLRGSLSPPQRHPGLCAYQQRSAAQDSAPTGPSRCRHWQMMHRTALHCTVPCWCSKQASNQARQAALSFAPPSASSHSLPDAECQMSEPQTNCTAPHRTAPYPQLQRHSFKPLPPPFPFPSLLSCPSISISHPPPALHRSPRGTLPPPPPPPLPPVWLRRSSRHRISADVFSPGPGFVFLLFFFVGGRGGGIRYVGSGYLGCFSGFGMTRMTGRDAAR